MEDKEEKEGEPEVITAKEFLEQHKDMKEEDVYRFVLVCKNCNHKDLLKNFLKKIIKGYDVSIKDPEPPPWKKYKPEPSPWKPKPDRPYYGDPPPLKRYTMKSQNKKDVMCMVNLVNSLHPADYEELFFCPKCGSSLVVLCPDYIKNNMTRSL